MSQHLTDEQFAELLAGGYSREAAPHLNTCTACADELERGRAAILDFSAVGLHRAIERSATMAQPSVRARPPLLARPAIWATAAAGLVFGVAFGVHRFEADKTAAFPAATALVHADQDQKAIDEDNALMSAIDADLRWKRDAAVNTPAALVLAPHKAAPGKLVAE